jgi:predicted dehydrogenase/nucleoside-diphosphate-sugar epimerase
MKVGIVGCGWIAEKHISFIKSISIADLVGIVDSDPERVREFASKYKITNYYTKVDELLERHDIKVIHVLTPPYSHKEVALYAIKKGIHVYIEKPISLTADEVKEIYDEAASFGVKVCAGYNLLFEPLFLDALRQIESPAFGKVIYVESYYGINIRRYDRMKTTKENEIHWSYHLPGGFHQNYISHPLCLLIKLLGKPRSLNVVCRQTGALPQNLTDDIRVIFEGEKGTGILGLSYACEPYQEYLKIQGEKQAIEIDWTTMTKLTHKNVRLPVAVKKVLYNNLSRAFQRSTSSFRNAFNLVRKKINPYQGIKNLIEEFYRSIEENRDPPLSADCALITEKTAEEILGRCSGVHLDFTTRPGSQKDIKREETILVTGASGFLGLATVKGLIREGYRVRAFVRKLSYIDKLEKLGAEIHFGDIRNYESLKRAIEGVDIVIHLAAATAGPAEEQEDITVGGLRNLIEIVQEIKVPRVIYMSSMSVYDVSDCERDQVLKEDHILERRPEERGAYSYSKTQAEKVALNELSQDSTKWTILRPSAIFGPGKTGSIGFSVGNKFRVIIGPAAVKLRLVHVDDVVEAIILSIQNDKSAGEIYNVNHPDRISKKEYIKNYVIPKTGRGLNIYVPFKVFYAGAFLVEKIFPLLKRKPFLTRYRLISSQKDVTFSSSKALNELGWRPRLSLDQSLKIAFNIKGR